MIATTLIRHQFYVLFRSNRAFSNFLRILFESLSLLFLAVGVFALGIWSPILLEDWLHIDAVTAGAVLLIPVGSLILFFRLLSQSTGTLQIKSYRLLPIPRKTLMHYVILRPLINPTSHIGLLFFVPFCIMSGIRTGHAEGALYLLINAWLMELAGSMFATAMHRRFQTNLTYVLTIYCLYILFIGLLWGVPETWHDGILATLKTLFSTPWGWSIWLSVGPASYGWHYHYFMHHWYEEGYTKQKEHVHANRLTFLTQYGSTGIMLHFVLKQYLRCRGLKAAFVGNLVIIVYCWVLATFNNALPIIVMGVAGGVFFTSRYIFTADSAHFDGLMTQNIRLQDYIRAQYYLILIFEVIAILLTAPLIFVDDISVIFFMVIAACAVGVMPLQMLWMSTFYTHYLDVNKREKFKHENLSLTHTMNLLILFIVPNILAPLAKHLPIVGYIVLGINVLALMLHRQIIQLITLQLKKNKYRMAAGFRER